MYDVIFSFFFLFRKIKISKVLSELPYFLLFYLPFIGAFKTCGLWFIRKLFKKVSENGNSNKIILLKHAFRLNTSVV